MGLTSRNYDIAYSSSCDLEKRHKVDKILENRASKRMKAAKSLKKEKVVAHTVMNAIKAERKLRIGCNNCSKCIK